MNPSRSVYNSLYNSHRPFVYKTNELNMVYSNKRWFGFTLLVGFWTIVAIMFVGAEFYRRYLIGEIMPVGLMLWYVLGMYLWIPSSLIVLWLVRKFPIRKSSWYRVIPFHLVASIWNSLFMATIYASLRYGWGIVSQNIEYGFLEILVKVFSLSLGVDLMLYLTILVAVHAFEYYRESRYRMLEAADLRAKLAEVQLQALKMQLHPHFLFNAFHTVSMLVRQHREDEAIDMIAGLGTLLRYVLDNALEQKVSLQQELQLLDHYLDIERIRFRDRLHIELKIDSDVFDAAVPNILLQPLVENSIRHGIVPGSNRGEIEITARREGDRLRIRIRDNGVGLPANWEEVGARNGIGLSNTRLRLERLYPGEHHIEVSNAAEGGCMVTIVIPFEPAKSDSPEKVQVAPGKTAVFEGHSLSVE